jgi:hypothetical protein
MKTSQALCVLGVVLLCLCSCCKKKQGKIKKIDWAKTHLADIVETSLDDKLECNMQQIEEEDEFWCGR